MVADFKLSELQALANSILEFQWNSWGRRVDGVDNFAFALFRYGNIGYFNYLMASRSW